MRSRVLRLLLKKELRDVFRDRKAIIMLVLVPLLIYPLIFFGSFAVMTMIQSSMEDGKYDVIVDVDDGGALMKQIAIYIQIRHQRIKILRIRILRSRLRQYILISSLRIMTMN